MKTTEILNFEVKDNHKNSVFFKISTNIKRSLLLFILNVTFLCAIAQPEFKIEGSLQSGNSNEVIPFATVALHRLSDSTLVSGTLSNAEGNFQLSTNKSGEYFLEISHLGFDVESVEISFSEGREINTGIIILSEKTVKMESLKVVGERLKAKSTGNTTVYYMNKKMEEASFSGTDVLKHIPGIQTDFMQNISLEGSSNLILRVDGIERDLDYLRRLDAKKIDKIEVINTPGSIYDADVTGVINIVLKEKETGINGHVYAEIPTSAKTMYLFPNYSLSYGSNKFNFYTSYNGEISYFDVKNSETRYIQSDSKNTNISVLENVRQNNWSHKFHFGIDFTPNNSNQFNFYGFLNPYSWEQNGEVKLDVHPEYGSNKFWAATKNDNDKNLQSFGSLYYKHIFENNQAITADISFYNLQASNSVLYQADSAYFNFPERIENTSQPNENRAILKIDYTLPFSESLKLNTGGKTTLSILKDKENKIFRFSKNIWAAYGELLFSKSDLDAQLGLRAEKSVSNLDGGFQNDAFAILPHFMFNWKINSGSQLKLIYRKSLNRPGLYDLNPTENSSGPLTLTAGNPELEQELSDYLALDYSRAFQGNFIAARLFWQDFNHFIHPYSFINDQGVLETEIRNQGVVQKYGLQVNGSLKLHKMITVNPYLKIFNIRSKSNGMTPETEAENVAFESGLSTLVAFKKTGRPRFRFSTTGECNIFRINHITTHSTSYPSKNR